MQFIYEGITMWVLHVYRINKTEKEQKQIWKSFSLLRLLPHKKLEAPPFSRTNFSLKSESFVTGRDRDLSFF